MDSYTARPRPIRFAPSTKSEGRERVRQACHRCRLKKLRCDGVVPCGRCISAGNICQHRERRKTGVDETHVEYVANMEEQQHLLSTALRLTWSHLFPQEATNIPSTHEMIARLRMLPHGVQIPVRPSILIQLPQPSQDDIDALRDANLALVADQLDQNHQQIFEDISLDTSPSISPDISSSSCSVPTPRTNTSFDTVQTVTNGQGYYMPGGSTLHNCMYENDKAQERNLEGQPWVEDLDGSVEPWKLETGFVKF